MEILKSTLERTTRIDSEFYKKENLFIDNTLKRQKTSFVSELTKVSDGNHMAVSENFQESGIPYYRGQDIHHYFIEQSNPICIDEETFNSPNMRRSHLQKGGVLLSIVGTIGGVSLVSADKKQTCNCKLAILRPKNIDGFYLSAFLKSKYGQNQVKKFTRGAVQMGLILEDMSQIAVPLLSDNFQLTVRSAIEKGQLKLEQSKTTYTTAENILLSEIGLTDFTPSNDPVNIKTFKESFATSGRLDAEYYSPKYEEIEKALTGYAGGYCQIKDAFTQNKSTFKIEENDTYQYVEIGSVNVSTGEITPLELLGSDLPPNAKRILRKGDVILSKVRTYRGAAAIIDTDGYVGSSAFTVLRENGNVNKETLLVFLKSKILREYSLKPNTGTSYPVIVDEDVLSFPLPLIPLSKQSEIAALITQSFALKKQSEHLLDVAKRAVEIAIEQDETVAMRWIEEQRAVAL